MGKVEYYLYMQFREHANRVNLNKLEQNQCPELELLADFKKDNLPRGMCAFFKDSNELYMVGGERTLRDYNYWRFGDDDGDDPKDAFSSDVFVLDSSTGKISPAPRFPKPNAAKTNARALATINGKVYVMNFMPYFYNTGLPSFECFDSLKFEWEELPPPPDCVMDSYCYHFVVGPKIYLRSLYGFYCYNVDESMWESVKTTKWQLDLSTSGYDSYDESESDSDEMEIQDYSVPMKLARPYHSICFAEPGKGGLAVGFTPKGLAAYLFAPDGELQFQQLLHSLNKDPKLPSPIEIFFGGKVCYAGENKFCLILSGRISQPTWSLGVATFDVKFKTSYGGGIHFYHENPLCYHQFDDVEESHMSNLHQFEENNKFPRLYDYQAFTDAFVMFDVKFKTSVAINDDGGGIHFYHENPLCYHHFDNVDSQLCNLHPFEENYKFPRLYNYDIYPVAFIMSSETKSERKRKREANSMEENYDGFMMEA